MMNAADTLSGALLRDTLRLRADSVSGPVRFDTVPAPETAAVQVHAEDIFGADSFLHGYAGLPVQETVSPTDNLPVQIATLCLLMLYVYMVLRYRRETGQLFRIIFSTGKSDHFADEHNYVFADFMIGLLAAGYLMIGIAAVKIAGLLTGEDIVLSIAGPLFVVVIAALTLVAINVVQQMVLRAVGAITLSQGFIRRLLMLRRLFFEVIIVVSTPVVLLFALAAGGAAHTLVHIFASIVALLLICYVYRSLRLFIDEKVSILLWMLYLCIVEVIPPAIILLAVLRSI